MIRPQIGSERPGPGYDPAQMRRLVLFALAAAVALPATAAAQDPAVAPAPAPAATPVATPTPVPAATPAAATLEIATERVGPKATVLSGDRWRVRGSLQPFVEGQTVTVRFYRGGKKIGSRTVRALRSSTGKSGGFVLGFRTRGAGPVTVRASHRATPQLGTAVAGARTVTVLPSSVRGGTTGAGVRALQRALRSHGYVIGKLGVLDARTSRAVLALRKNLGMARTGQADRAVMRRLANGQGAYPVRFPNHGRHIEADISKQVMALIGEGGKVERIYHISGGAPSTPTILGSFRVYRRDLGTNALGMVHAAYFIRGYAIHGYKSVPTFGASHGCLRVPTPDALSIRNWTRMGTIVDTYR